MAQPVPFRRYVPEDTKNDLTRKIEAAPTEHAEAILSGYQLLQQLHDTGTLNLLRGMFGAGGAVVNHVVDIVSAPDIVNILRNGLSAGTLIAGIDPDALHSAIHGKPEERKNAPPSLWVTFKRMFSPEARLGLSVAVSLLVMFGGAIKKQRAITAE